MNIKKVTDKCFCEYLLGLPHKWYWLTLIFQFKIFIQVWVVNCKDYWCFVTVSYKGYGMGNSAARSLNNFNQCVHYQIWTKIMYISVASKRLPFISRLSHQDCSNQMQWGTTCKTLWRSLNIITSSSVKKQSGSSQRVMSDGKREQKETLYYYCEIGCGDSNGEL